jgi:uncharacterized SAM-binding protein YcdF (DUF218 family)
MTMTHESGLAWMLRASAKLVGPPGSLTFLTVCVGLGLVAIYIWPRHRGAGRGWLLLVAGVYLALSLPCTAGAITDRLPTPARSSAVRPIDTLIVLDGDNWRGRVRTAGAAFAADAPRVVWVFGHAWLLEPLMAAGIPSSKIAHVSGDATTRGQMTHLRMLYASSNPGSMAIVASRLHMPRVAALAHTMDLPVAQLPSPLDDEPPVSGVWRLIPAYSALRASQDALYEHAALAYYRWHGWIIPP